ncbi:TetR family transcriptional regulator [Nonomuraea phyllanthi]|uniref:TetR family transcriptional regulator n=1 Tax=Nonomuraea phyllanthi TaxID=2219224 RepID=A0A5C4VIZ7_9ACTN|nr:TetR/AcrR family transcriptional regulator [Nonomuraea phyllanthi]KAB8189253.1 TetR family transcriptional regulator [Nonomuraea phyllanthi]
MSKDFRRKSRRRGDELEAAIFRAVVAHLVESGYPRLTVEAVAKRAHTGKASIYRRWPTRTALVAAVVAALFSEAMKTPDTGDFRDDVLALLRGMADVLSGPAGEGMRGLLSEAPSDSQHMRDARSLVHGLGRGVMEAVVRKAAERGEVACEAIRSSRLEVGQALIHEHFLFGAAPVSDELIVGIVDDVVLPLFLSAP